MNNGMWKKKKKPPEPEGVKPRVGDDQSPIILCVYWEGDGEHLEGTAEVSCHFCGVDLALSPSGQRARKDFEVRPACAKCTLEAVGLGETEIPDELREMIEKRQRAVEKRMKGEG